MLAKVDEVHAATLANAKPAALGAPVEDPAKVAAAAATPPADAAKPADEATPKADEKDPAAEAAKSAGLDMTALNEEFATSGTLSEASYQALDKVGISKDVVDNYIAGQQALAVQRDNEGYGLAGGKDQYTNMVTWAASNMSPAEIEAFNGSVTGDPAQMKQAILGLKAAYEGALGSDPALLKGGASVPSGETAFGSRAEVTAAMRDRRYANDPAYRAMVERRVGLMDNF